MVCAFFAHTTQHGGKISHQNALEKSNKEFEKYQGTQRLIQKENSLMELEKDLQLLSKQLKLKKE